MNSVPTRNDILAATSERGLLAYLFDVAQTHSLHQETEFLATIAELAASGERTLYTESDWTSLNAMNESNFFSGLSLACELIPLLDLGHRDMMQFVTRLVHLGGRDGAANQPYGAFRLWCSADPTRSRAVLDAAHSGDGQAIAHLRFALEAGAQSEEALKFLDEGPNAKAQIHAALALGRMSHDHESAVAAVGSLSEVSMTTDDADVRSSALLSSFAILQKNTELPRDNAKRALNKVLADTSTEALETLSTLIWRHGESLSEDETLSVLSALQSVDLDRPEILERIDVATSSLSGRGQFCELSDLVAELIRKSQGKLGLNNFPRFCGELVVGDHQRLGRLLVSWFHEGNPYLCSSLAGQFTAIGGQPMTLNLQPDDIPEGPEEQLFVCRKAVGFLFHTPVTAASVLVAFLRHGDVGITEKLLTLLYNPLLVSFGGELHRYLEQIVEQGSASRTVCIREVLNRKKKYLDDLAGIDTLVELLPSESHRHIEGARWNRLMTQAMKKSMDQSFIRRIATTHYLLYGEGSSSYFETPDGELRRVDMQRQPYSASIDLPQLAFLDSEGLQGALQLFQLEQRANE